MLSEEEDVEPRDVRPDEHLTYLMAKAGHLLERRIDEAVGRVGLTLRQFSALAHIARRPGLSVSDLARALLISPQAVNTLVSRLVAAQLVERAPSRPRQPLVLTLTGSGLDALRRAEPLATRAEAAALASIAAEDLDATRRALLGLLEDLTPEASGGRGT